MHATITNKKFFFAGNATFTVHNNAGEHFTFKAKKPSQGNKRDHEGPVFLMVLSGPNNESDYRYAGILRQDGSIAFTKGSKISPDAKSVKVAQWAVKKVLAGAGLPEGYGIHHDGSCARCGRTLTTPESVERGIGPECMKHAD